MQTKVPSGRIDRITDTVVRELNGDEVMRISSNDITIFYSNGEHEKHREYDNIILADASIWNVAMLAAKIYLGVCSLCRRPPYTFPFRRRATHGLVRLSSAKACPCGVLCCPAHCRQGDDGVWRCLRCTRRFTVHRGIRSIFFHRE
jgi:hypothetical protein